jgi:pyrimidine operon attenuation protein/uracil phosphoribosyltransferase
MAKTETVILDQSGINRALTRIAHEILERNKGTTDLVLVGIRSGGDDLAGELRRRIAEIEGEDIPAGTVDITMYRDDLGSRGSMPVGRTEIPFAMDGKRVILVDDVLYTGRTVRAALNEIMDFGRPRRILLAVLVDRGHREIPIRADFVGKNVPTSQSEQIKVKVEELDGTWEVELTDRGPSKG